MICAVLPMGLFTAGCGSTGIGEAGFHEVVAGNWPAAKVDFTEDYQKYPDHPIAVFNMGATHHHDGSINQADVMFAEAVTRGKGYVPDVSLEPASAGPTIAEQACARLHRDNKLDANCGDRIVAMEAPPAVVAQAEPAPAVEAQATEVPEPMPPKQARN
jgi:hypothetical protein